MTYPVTYLDHAATTPVLPEVLAAMAEQLGRVGNASSLLASGRAARPSEVLFTSGGTESDNLAVKGLFWARRQADPARRRIVASPAEHHAVLDSVEWLAKHDGAEVTWLAVEPSGRITPGALADALGDGSDVAVASVMWANNEIGAVSDIAALAEVAHAVGVPLHTDAVQAVGQVEVDFGASGVDALTRTGHKLGGPMGAGALLLRRDAECTPLRHGGGQERDVRSGTLDVAAIVGLAVATAAPGRRAPRTCPSPARRATRCSCCSTPGGSSAPPARRAARGSPAPATCCSPSVPTRNGPAARCASASVTRRPTPTSTRCSR